MPNRVETIGDCTLYLGDCLEILPTLGKVDAVVTDPPYGVGLGDTRGCGDNHGLRLEAYASYDDTYGNFVKTIVPALNTALIMSRRGAVFSGPHIHEQRKPDAIGGVYLPATSARHCWGFKSFVPILLYGTAPDINKGSKHTAIVSSEKPDRSHNPHPVPKPLGWMTWLVDLSSRYNELILDPFMGSGTTGVACVKLGRRFIGIEIDPGYFEIACQRIRDAYAQGDLFRSAPRERPVQTTLEVG
jgi:DNA modification methylase